LLEGNHFNRREEMMTFSFDPGNIVKIKPSRNEVKGEGLTAVMQ
jgi:hypothetical protein